MSLDNPNARLVALNRFGLGGRPGELEHFKADPREWLASQLEAKSSRIPESMRDLPDSRVAADEFEKWQIARLRERRRAKSGDEAADAAQMFRKAFQKQFVAEVAARGSNQVSTDTPFFERLVMFWSNHFAVSADKPQVTVLAGPFEREAIRPNVLGKFSDLLLAVEQHPAMLRYLDNAASFGPNSDFVRDPPRKVRRRLERTGQKLGLNENLAREILELHTLGVSGGYAQADVIELAKAITGWTIETRLLDTARPIGPFGFAWLEDGHEPGPRRLLGRDYPATGLKQGEAILGDLARHPSTARFVATKLARHFVADEPPAALVARLERSFIETDGYLPAVYRTLLGSDEAWQPRPVKLKRPEEFLVSAMRATGLPPPREPQRWAGALALLGQPALRPGSPAGWADRASDWIGSDGLWKRFEIAERLGDQSPSDVEPLALARDALGPWLHADTAEAINRAESPQQAVALLLASPEFQWR